MVTALLIGLLVGFVLAIPPRPALACLQHALRGQTRAGVALALGAAVIDSGAALLAAYASSAMVGALWERVVRHPWALVAFQGGCILVLVVVGLRACRAVAGDAAQARPAAGGAAQRAASPVLRGLLIALTNLASPTFLPSLVFVMSLVHVRGWVSDTGSAHLMYALGFGGGGTLWFVLLLRVLTPLRAQVSPTLLPLIERVAAGVVLLCAGGLAYQMVTTTAWAPLLGW